MALLAPNTPPRAIATSPSETRDESLAEAREAGADSARRAPPARAARGGAVKPPRRRIGVCVCCVCVCVCVMRVCVCVYVYVCMYIHVTS